MTYDDILTMAYAVSTDERRTGRYAFRAGGRHLQAAKSVRDQDGILVYSFEAGGHALVNYPIIEAAGDEPLTFGPYRSNDWSDIVDMIHAVPDYLHDECAFFIGEANLKHLLAVKTTTGHFAVMVPVGGGLSLSGFPLYVSPGIAALRFEPVRRGRSLSPTDSFGKED